MAAKSDPRRSGAFQQTGETAMTKDNDTNNEPVELIVFAGSGADLKAAEKLAEHLCVSMAREESALERAALVLCLDANGLALSSGGQTLRGDFTRMLPRLRRGNLQSELLVRAAKIKGADGALTAVDATAGLGEDALLLAAAGFSVRLYEYNPVIAALLRDALRRAETVPELADAVGRMQLFEADSLSALPQLPAPPDVILLDPMFPARQKSALVKKKLQLLQQLERPCSDETALVQVAIAARPRKVIIKRPLKGPYLAGKKPDYSLTGKAIRVDCLVLPRVGE